MGEGFWSAALAFWVSVISLVVATDIVGTVFDRLTQEKRRLLEELRARIMQLDRGIIEQVRPHRIVYSKNFLMMDFAEITLRGDAILVVPIARGQAEPIFVRDEESIARAVEAVSQALKRLSEG